MYVTTVARPTMERGGCCGGSSRLLEEDFGGDVSGEGAQQVKPLWW